MQMASRNTAYLARTTRLLPHWRQHVRCRPPLKFAALPVAPENVSSGGGAQCCKLNWHLARRHVRSQSDECTKVCTLTSMGPWFQTCWRSGIDFRNKTPCPGQSVFCLCEQERQSLVKKGVDVPGTLRGPARMQSRFKWGGTT